MKVSSFRIAFSLFIALSFLPLQTSAQQFESLVEELKFKWGNYEDKGKKENTMPDQSALELGFIDEKCGTHLMEQMRMKNSIGPSIEQFEEWMSQSLEIQRRSVQTRSIMTIPVVVHVIHNGEAVGDGSNISDAQVFSQIPVLNADFRRMNADASNTPADFLGVAADLELEFCLANVDPEGNAINGINRYNGGQSSYSIYDLENFIKPATIWNPEYYFNIWVAPLQGGLLGYAQFPEMSMLSGLPPEIQGGPDYSDGIVVRDYAFGTTGSARAPWNLGRTATHEVGHFFGLRHMGGDGDCSVDDFCADTPTQLGQNENTEDDCSYPADNDCDDGPGDLPDQFMNYMDYSDDACMNLFTLDQKARVNAVIMNSPRRNFSNSNVCSGVQPPLWQPAAPVNDLCENAIPLGCDDLAIASIAFSTSTGEPPSCDLSPLSPGVWYSFSGNGDLFSVTSSYKISLYSGLCGSLTCVGTNDPDLFNFNATVPTTINETIYIYVSRSSLTQGLGTDGFLFTSCISNDLCDNAILVQCGDFVSGTTIGTTTTGTPLTDCRLFDQPWDVEFNDPTIIPDDLGPGIWYRMVGTGERIILSTCDAASYDTKIDVFTGTCDNLICVEGNEDGEGCSNFTSAFGFDSNIGQDYFIYVSGYTDDNSLIAETGFFTLSVCPGCDIFGIEPDPFFDPAGVAECGPDGTFVFGVKIDGPQPGNLARENDGLVDLSQFRVQVDGSEVPVLAAGLRDLGFPFPPYIVLIAGFPPGNGESIDVIANVRDDCSFEQPAFMDAPECDCYTGIVRRTISPCSESFIGLEAESNNTLEGGYWTIVQGSGTIDDVNDPNTYYRFSPGELGSEVVISWTQPASGNCSTVVDFITLDQIICIPTLTEWSLIILALMLLIIGVIVLQSVSKESVLEG